jgi:hypothetical protein
MKVFWEHEGIVKALHILDFALDGNRLISRHRRFRPDEKALGTHQMNASVV